MDKKISFYNYPTIFFLTLLTQFILVAISFPITELFSSTPILHIDSTHHWYQINVAVDLARQGKLTGYDPFFAAGYLGGIPYNTSVKMPALIAAATSPWISSAVAFKLFSFICAILSPLAIVATARILRLDIHIGSAVAVLALILWWASPVRWYHTSGIVSWAFVVFIATLFATYVISYLTKKNTNRTLLWITLSAALLILIHPLFPMAAIFAIAFLFIAYWKEIAINRLILAIIFVPLISLILNFPWINVLLYQPGIADGNQPYQQAVDINMIWQNMLGLPSQDRGSKFYFILVLLSLWGIAGQSNKQERILAITLFMAGISTLIFAAIGASIPVVTITQPNRFGVQGYVLMLIPAAIGVANIFRAMKNTGITRLAGMGSCLLGAVALIYFMHDIRREISPGTHGRHGDAPPQVRDIGPISRWALDQLNQQTDTSARVMFELSFGRIHDGAHIAGYLAKISDREFIGGTYPHTHFANFQDNWAFGRELSTMPIDSFLEYIDLYNVGWLIVHTDAAKNYLANIPSITLIAKNDQLSFYRVQRSHSFFIEGNGTVLSRAVNQVTLSDLEGDTIILKYHYIPGMRSEPPVDIEGIKMLDDPQPFIKITHPPKTLRLYVP